MALAARAERARVAIYRTLASTGAAPAPAEMAALLDTDARGVREAIQELAADRHLVLDDGRIVLAHPFATRSFGFSVMGPDTLWRGGCAWDAFAIPHLVPTAAEVLVATTCPACGAAHAWTVTNQGPPDGDQVAHFLVPTDRIWPDAAHACERQQIFCSHDCVDRWLTTTGRDRGYVMSLTTLWRLAERW